MARSLEKRVAELRAGIPELRTHSAAAADAVQQIADTLELIDEHLSAIEERRWMAALDSLDAGEPRVLH
jgi:hypothetical protein